MSISDLVRRMGAAGATPEAIAIAVEALEQASPSKGAERTRRWRERHKASQSVTEASPSVTPVTPEASQTVTAPPAPLSSSLSECSFLPSSDSEEERKKEPLESGRARSNNPANWPPDAWEQFYGPYPNKVGKKPARRAFERIQKRGEVPWLVLYGGLQRYLAKTDDRAWCNPATWLNEERWEDQPAPNGGGNVGFGQARNGAAGGSRKPNGESFLAGMAAVIAKRPDSRLYRGDAGGRGEGPDGRPDDREEPLTLDLDAGSYRETGG